MARSLVSVSTLMVMVGWSSRLLLAVVLLGEHASWVLAWSPPIQSIISNRLGHHSVTHHGKQTAAAERLVLHAAPRKQSRSTVVDTQTATQLQEEETPAGVEGAQFFGGNKLKVELYDPVAEEQADLEFVTTGTVAQVEEFYNRFADCAAFGDDRAAALARDLQLQINDALYSATDTGEGNGSSNTAAASQPQFVYAPTCTWDTVFLQTKTKRPLDELENALNFYNRIDLAITSGKSIRPNIVQLSWELSLVWPTIWEPRVLLTGISQLTLQENDDSITTKIVHQHDTLHEKDLMNALIRQIIPRFWDIYHIGMTPSSEVSPKLPATTTLAKSSSVLTTLSRILPGSIRYQLYDLPARLYLQPTMLDIGGDRDEANAGFIPNHAFNCVIKTMGPTRQRYIPASPVQVQLQPLVLDSTSGSKVVLRLQWQIPLAVEYQAAPGDAADRFLLLHRPGPDPEADPASQPACDYVWQPARRVATVSYGGRPQDAAIVDLRKRLYEQVVADGLKPATDDNGRPIFFFWENSVKACYTEKGLGMAVYEWRPSFAKSNEVGIELEMEQE